MLAGSKSSHNACTLSVQSPVLHQRTNITSLCIHQWFPMANHDLGHPIYPSVPPASVHSLLDSLDDINLRVWLKAELCTWPCILLHAWGPTACTCAAIGIPCTPIALILTKAKRSLMPTRTHTPRSVSSPPTQTHYAFLRSPQMPPKPACFSPNSCTDGATWLHTLTGRDRSETMAIA